MKFWFLLIGVLLIVIGITFNILYLNLISTGYNFNEYVHFIFRRWEFFMIIAGTIIIFTILFKEGRKK